MRARRPGNPFALSVLVALCLQFVPLPEALATARPYWLALVLGYWALYGSDVPLISTALFAGLAADTLHDTPLGQHVIALTLLVYTLTRMRSTLTMYPAWQVALLLLPLWAVYALLLFVLDGMARHPSQPLGRFLPVAFSLPAWLLVYSLLDRLRGKRFAA